MMQVEVKSGTMTKDEIQYYILLVKKRWGTRLPADLRLILEKTDAEVQMLCGPVCEGRRCPGGSGGHEDGN